MDLDAINGVQCPVCLQRAMNVTGISGDCVQSQYLISYRATCSSCGHQVLRKAEADTREHMLREYVLRDISVRSQSLVML